MKPQLRRTMSLTLLGYLFLKLDIPKHLLHENTCLFFFSFFSVLFLFWWRTVFIGYFLVLDTDRRGFPMYAWHMLTPEIAG